MVVNRFPTPRLMMGVVTLGLTLFMMLMVTIMLPVIGRRLYWKRQDYATISANIPDNISFFFCIASTSSSDLQARRPYFRIPFACYVFPPIIKYASGVPCVS
jgi:hypothetical protein